jgi:hypothetical protein
VPEENLRRRYEPHHSQQLMVQTLEPREKQLRDVKRSGGNQPTYISMINRRSTG